MERIVPERLATSLRGMDAQALQPKPGPAVSPDVSTSLPEGCDLVCYDTETTDKFTSFCQILQFAGLRTDRHFNVVQTRNLLVRLLPYVVPSPGAMMVNGVDFRSLDDEDRHDEYDAALALQDLLSAPRNQTRIFLTFNGISFDDEIIRRTLHRNLLFPYFTRDGDSRIDVLTLSRLVANAPDIGFSVPHSEDARDESEDEERQERKSFKLTSLCEANGIDLANAHDALGDAGPTLALANLIREIAPWAWNLAFACGIPQTAIRRAEAAKAGGKPLWLFDPYGGSGRDAFIPCAVVGLIKKQVILANLNVLSDCSLPHPLPSPRDMAYCGKEGRDEIDNTDIRPVIVERLNKGRYLLTSDEVRHFRSEASIALMDDAAMRFSRRTADIKTLDAHAQTPQEWVNGITAEENIYGSRPQNEDREKALAREFSSVRKWPDAISHGMEMADWRHRDFAARILLRMCSEAELDARGTHLAAELARRAEEALARPFGNAPADGEKGWMTVAKALEDPLASDEMREWLRSRYVDPSEPVADEEMGCGLGAAMPGR